MFESRFFFSSRTVILSGLNTQTSTPFTHSWRDKWKIRDYPKWISTKLNTNGIIQDLIM